MTNDERQMSNDELRYSTNFKMNLPAASRGELNPKRD